MLRFPRDWIPSALAQGHGRLRKRRREPWHDRIMTGTTTVMRVARRSVTVDQASAASGTTDGVTDAGREVVANTAMFASATRLGSMIGGPARARATKAAGAIAR